MSQTIEEKCTVERETGPDTAVFRPLEIGQDGTAFRMLNEEWISRYFVLEAKDCETLGDPEGTILRKGGRVYQAWAGEEVVGCVALIPMGDGVYELSKMAVSLAVRGRGIGRKLLEYAIAQARGAGCGIVVPGEQLDPEERGAFV